MNKNEQPGKAGIPRQNADIGVARLALDMLRRGMSAPTRVPRLLFLEGERGMGKTWAMARCAAELGAYDIELMGSWTPRYFGGELCRRMGLPDRGCTADLIGRAAEQLTLSGRPLAVDEAGYFLKTANGAAVLKDLLNSDRNVLMLIANEDGKVQLARRKDLNTRVFIRETAPKADIDDARALAAIHAPALVIDDDAMAHMVDDAHGNVRKLCRALVWADEERLATGIRTLSLAKATGALAHMGA